VQTFPLTIDPTARDQKTENMKRNLNGKPIGLNIRNLISVIYSLKHF